MMSWHQATTLEALLSAAARAARGKRDQPKVARFMMDAEKHCLRLQHALRLPVDHPGAWWPGPTETFAIRDPKPRRITVAPFPDRVVHHALCPAFEPVLEGYSIHHSYACWKGKGQHRALRQCQRFARSAPWVIKGDIRSFFSSIPHALLLQRFRQRVPDREIAAWIARALAGPRPGVPVIEGRGLPIGALTSQHLANFYLGHLDHWLTDGLGFGRYLRYMDDFVIFGGRVELRGLLPKVASFLAKELGLRLNERQSRLQPVRDGISFLGFRVYPRQIRIANQRWKRSRQRQGYLAAAYGRGELSQADLGLALTSLYAHLEAFDTYKLRRRHLERQMSVGRGRARLQPGDPGRLLEEQPAQRTGCEPQQERALQAQRQPGVSRRELNTSEPVLKSASAIRPVEATSRSGLIDQTSDPCPGRQDPLVFSFPGTESTPPGGGTNVVAAGLLSRKPA